MQINCAYTKLVNPKDLTPSPDNANRHSVEQIALLCELIEAHGWRHPIIVSNQSGKIVCGEGRWMAAQKLGIQEVPVDYQDFATPEVEYQVLVSDNEIARYAELDLHSVHVKIKEMPTIDVRLLAIDGFEPEKEEGLTDPDEVPETPENPVSRLGDLWILGEHRLLCGDCTVKENVDLLMNGEKADMVFTDPPYGMNLDTDYTSMGSKNNFKKIIGDDKYFDPTTILDLFKDVTEMFLWGADYYCWSLPQGGSWIVWDKRSHGEGNIGTLDGSFGADFELCWTKQKHQRKICRVIRNKGAFIKRREGVETMHPSQKPVECVEWFLDKWANTLKNIWDGFLGSGSTLIACEKTNRKCFGMEIDPIYCDIIVIRWQNFTGKQATLNGKTFDQVKAERLCVSQSI